MDDIYKYKYPTYKYKYKKYKTKYLNIKEYNKGGNSEPRMSIYKIDDKSGIFYQELYYLSAHLTKNQKFRNMIKEQKWGMKKIVNKPVDLTKAKYNSIFPPNNYLLTYKADVSKSLRTT